MKSAELDQGKKLIGFGGLFGFKDIYEKDVTSSKQKPQKEGERIEEMWQMTAKRRTGDVEQRSAQIERTNSRSRVTAEGKPRNEVRLQEKVAKENAEEAKMEKVKVPVNVV